MREAVQFNQASIRLAKSVTDLTKAVNKMADGAEKTRLQAALKAFGTGGDENNVFVSFTKLDSGVAGTTTPTHNSTSGEDNFNVVLDPRANTNGTVMAINAAHEGTHVSDFEIMQNPQFKGTVLDDFQKEYRGYQTSSWAAQTLGVPSLTVGGKNVIWNSSWAQVDRQSNMDTAITNHVVDKDHPDPGKGKRNPWSD